MNSETIFAWRYTGFVIALLGLLVLGVIGDPIGKALTASGMLIAILTYFLRPTPVSRNNTSPPIKENKEESA